MNRLQRLLIAIILGALGGLAQAQELDNFSTLERVEYVLGCMREHGGENYDNLYACVCAVDYIRTQFSYDEYNEALAFRQLRETAGERGSVFRDPERAKQLRAKLQQVDAAAAKQCFLKHAAKQ